MEYARFTLPGLMRFMDLCSQYIISSPADREEFFLSCRNVARESGFQDIAADDVDAAFRHSRFNPTVQRMAKEAGVTFTVERRI